MFGKFRTRKAGIDPPFTHHPTQIVWCTGDSVRNQFVHVWRCFASFGAANVNKKTRPMSRWCWWLQQPVGKPQSRNEMVRRRVCFGIPHACLFKRRDWTTIWKKKKEETLQIPFTGIHLWNPQILTILQMACIDLWPWTFTCFYVRLSMGQRQSSTTKMMCNLDILRFRLKSSKNEEISTCIQNKEANMARPLGKRPLQGLFSIFKPR